MSPQFSPFATDCAGDCLEYIIGYDRLADGLTDDSKILNRGWQTEYIISNRSQLFLYDDPRNPSISLSALTICVGGDEDCGVIPLIKAFGFCEGGGVANAYRYAYACTKSSGTIQSDVTLSLDPLLVRAVLTSTISGEGVRLVQSKLMDRCFKSIRVLLNCLHTLKHSAA